MFMMLSTKQELSKNNQGTRYIITVQYAIDWMVSWHSNQ